MILRNLTGDDLPQVLSWRNSPDVRKYMYTSHEITWAEHLAWYEKNNMETSRRDLIFSNCGVDCGVICFSNYNEKSRNAFWGFYTAPHAQNGTGLKMEYSALEYAFQNLNLHKLNCEALGFNKKVINMHKKAGFKEEGVFRDYHFNGEKYIDVVRLGILQSEWLICRDAVRIRINQID